MCNVFSKFSYQSEGKIEDFQNLMFFQFADSFFNFSDRPRHPSQTSKRGNRAQPVAIVESGNAGNDFAVFDIVTGRGFCRHDRVVADSQMSGDADLSGENYAFSDDRTSGKSGLRANQRVFFDRAGMSDLHEIVNFRAAFYSRFADRSAVNRRIRADFHIVFDDDTSRLRNFQPTFFFVFSVAETVRADSRIVVNNTIFADFAIFTNGNARMNHRICADFRAVVNCYIRKNFDACFRLHNFCRRQHLR